MTLSSVCKIKNGLFLKDKFYKGRIRNYSKALALGVIDKRIAPLVHIFNCPGLMLTVGSCQGHGIVFVRVPAYLSFKSSSEIAIALDLSIRNCKRLNYRWCITNSIDTFGETTYVLEIPDLSSGIQRHVFRHYLDKDFSQIGLIAQKVLDHFKCKKLKMES